MFIERYDFRMLSFIRYAINLSKKSESMLPYIYSDIDDLSDYNSFGFGYVLNRAILEEADISITVFSGDLSYESTGEGELKNSSSGYNELKYTCDTEHGASGAPVYSDLIYEGEHYYVVIGIHTSGNGSYNYNSGVRMCPNIMNLIGSITTSS